MENTFNVMVLLPVELIELGDVNVCQSRLLLSQC